MPVNKSGDTAGPAAGGGLWGATIRRVCGDTVIEHDNGMFYFEVEIFEGAQKKLMTVGLLGLGAKDKKNQHIGKEVGSYGYAGQGVRLSGPLVSRCYL